VARHELISAEEGRMKFAVALGLVGIALAFGVAFVSRGKAPGAVVRSVLAGHEFVYARAYARDDATASGGAVDRLSFLTAANFGAVTTKDAEQTITLNLTPKDDSTDPGERAATLYARFLSPVAQDGPEGLVRRQFEAGSPYDFEELYLAPPDGRRFYARCLKPPVSAPNEACLSMFRDGAFHVELRYPPSLHSEWDVTYDGARAFIRRMTATPARGR
jgi:hypothetical protein